MGSQPWETVLHELLQCGSFSGAAVLHKLLQGGSFPHGAALQEQAAPVWVPHRVLGPASKVLRHGLLSPQGHRSCQEPAPVQAPHGVTAFLECVRLLWLGALHRLQVCISSTMDLHGLQGDSLPHYGLHHELRGNLCSGTWSTSSPFFFTDIGVCRVVALTYSYSFLLAAVGASGFFFPLLRYVNTEVLLPWLMDSTLASGVSILELAMILSDMEEASGSFSQKPPL